MTSTRGLIVVGVDGSPEADEALAELCRRY